MVTSAACTLKLELYIGAQKGLSTKMKLGLLGKVAHRNLSFRRFEKQRKKISRMHVRDTTTDLGNFCLQNGNKTWVRLGASHLQYRDSGMASRADTEITELRLASTDTVLPACYKQHKIRKK